MVRGVISTGNRMDISALVLILPFVCLVQFEAGKGFVCFLSDSVVCCFDFLFSECVVLLTICASFVLCTLLSVSFCT